LSDGGAGVDSPFSFFTMVADGAKQEDGYPRELKMQPKYFWTRTIQSVLVEEGSWGSWESGIGRRVGPLSVGPCRSLACFVARSRRLTSPIFVITLNLLYLPQVIQCTVRVSIHEVCHLDSIALYQNAPCTKLKASETARLYLSPRGGIGR
jgi:hypothetical protein